MIELRAGERAQVDSVRVALGDVAVFHGRVFLCRAHPGRELHPLDGPLTVQALTDARLEPIGPGPSDLSAEVIRRRERMERGFTKHVVRPASRLEPGPYHSRGVRMDLFVVELARPVALPHHLLRVPGVGRRALIVTALFPNFGTTTKGGEPFEYAEIACMIPCIHPFRGGALYCPELRPDNLVAATTGREMQGFPKRLAQAVETTHTDLTFVLGDQVRLTGRWSPRPCSRPEFVDTLVDTLLGGDPLADAAGDLAGWILRVVGMKPLLKLMPHLPLLVRRRAPSSCVGGPLDELRGIPFDFGGPSQDIVGLPGFRLPRAFHRLDEAELQWFGPSWYRGRALGGWRVTLDLELGEARQLGPRGWLRDRLEPDDVPTPKPGSHARFGDQALDGDLAVLERTAADDRAIFDPGPDSVLADRSVEGGTQVDLLVLQGDPTALDHLPPDVTALSDRRVLLIERGGSEAAQRGAGLFIPAEHPRHGRVLYAVERWLAHAGPMHVARERLCHPARWGALRDGVLEVDGQQLFELDHPPVDEDALDPAHWTGVPVIGNALPVLAWWCVTGFRSGPRVDRLVPSQLVFHGARSGLGPGVARGFGPGWPDQQILGGVRFEGTSVWRGM